MEEFFENERLFGEQGHLTDAGLQALQEGTLDELGRLEAAEHLAFCDACLERYAALAESQPDLLLDPPQDPVAPVQRTLRARSLRIVGNRSVRVAAAVVLAFTIWTVGLFGGGVHTVHREPAKKPSTGISTLMSGALANAQNTLDGLLGQVQSNLQTGLKQINQQNNKGE